jgi:hypothetical protein
MGFWKKLDAFERGMVAASSAAVAGIGDPGQRSADTSETGITDAGYRSINRLRALFDGRAHFVAPFSPGTVVVANVIQA